MIPYSWPSSELELYNKCTRNLIKLWAVRNSWPVQLWPGGHQVGVLWWLWGQLRLRSREVQFLSWCRLQGVHCHVLSVNDRNETSHQNLSTTYSYQDYMVMRSCSSVCSLFSKLHLPVICELLVGEIITRFYLIFQHLNYFNDMSLSQPVL